MHSHVGFCDCAIPRLGVRLSVFLDQKQLISMCTENQAYTASTSGLLGNMYNVFHSCLQAKEQLVANQEPLYFRTGRTECGQGGTALKGSGSLSLQPLVRQPQQAQQPLIWASAGASDSPLNLVSLHTTCCKKSVCTCSARCWTPCSATGPVRRLALAPFPYTNK